MFKVQERRAGAKAIWCKTKGDALCEALIIISKGKQFTCTDREGRECFTISEVSGNLAPPKADNQPKA